LGLVAARVAMGALYLYEGIGQLAKGWIGGDGLRRMVQSALDDNAIPGPYRSFLEDVVIEHAGALTPLIIAGELAVGAALVLGAATRLTAAAALVMNANFYVMNGAVTPGAAIDAVFVVLEAPLIVWAARQALSIDRALARRGVARWWLSGDVREAA